MNKKKIKMLIAFLVFVGGIGALIWTSMGSTVIYYMKPSELIAKARNQGRAINDERVRVGGIVITGTVKGSAAKRQWEFMITDGREDKILPVAMSKTRPDNRLYVRYKGIAPDTFKEGVIGIVEGNLNKDGVFMADTLLAKCPSKYEAEQQKDKEMAKKGAADKQAGRSAEKVKSTSQ